MSRLFSFITLLAWALWLGGLITLFIRVMTLFNNDRSAAAQTAPQMFLTFERYQLIIAAIALTAAVGWWISTRRRALIFLFILLSLAAFGAVVTPMYLTRKMEILPH